MTEEDLSKLTLEDNTSDDEILWPDTVRSSAKLRNYLCEKTVEGMFDKVPQDFIPEGTVERCLNRNIVMFVLRIKDATKEQDELITFIMESAPRAFATIVMAKINANKAMRWLKEHNIADRNLPIKMKKDEWTESWRSEFYSAQWMFFATVFSTTNYSHDLREAHIIPFVEKKCEAGQGSFGVVSQYIIHKAHMQPPGSEDLIVAVKEVKPESDAQEVAVHWEREVSALRRMNDLNHEHIVRFITAFRRHTRSGGAEHYLMFEWADGGNLSNLWRRMPSPILTEELIKEVIEQVLGLATALDAAHNLNDTGASFRHGDLKPENILIFMGKGLIGTFKIGDWGEAKYQGQRTEMRPSGSKSRHGTIRYEAPEVKTGIPETYEGQATERRSRLYDIWALGCITLELIVWLLRGWDGLKQFNTEVTGESFYEIDVMNGDNVARVHSAAIQWMDRLARSPACSPDTGLGRLLELVRTSLLVVKLPHRLGSMLAVSETARLEQYPRLDSGTGYELEHIKRLPGYAVNGTTSAIAPVTPTSNGVVDLPRIEVTSDTSSQKATPEGRTNDVVSNKAVLDLITLNVEKRTLGSPTSQRRPDLVERKIVPLQRKPERKANTRGLSRDICKFLVDILTEDDSVGYWNTDQAEQLSPATATATVSTIPRNNVDAPANAPQLRETVEHRSVSVQDTSRRNYDPPVLDPNNWKLHWDNLNASGLLESLVAAHASDFPVNRSPSKLCDNCAKYSRDLLSPGFRETYHVSTLKDRAKGNCDMCKLLWRTCYQNGGQRLDYVQFDRLGPLLKMDNSSKAVLSVVRLPGTDDLMGIESQIGFAQLPPAGCSTHLGVVRHWLKECDEGHRKCKSSGRTIDGGTCLPTRLLDVGLANEDTVQLWETKPENTGEWLALSHQWGEEMYHFSTTSSNLQEHLEGISMNRLPATFRDAVLVTRALGHRYLWIDSLCIVQGSDGDFEKEAKRMEDVYSGAYCVIAASCASNHADGFLKPRRERDYVGIIPEGDSKMPVYICEYIDNFKQHVSEGSLNRRGWVLQEHALARRTIFFTEHQTYFECSDGIQCETSTKMNNNVAALLGDSNFPNTLYTTSQGGKILQYQGLYEQYSRLGLSKPWDRPVAIQGLQQRLLDTMGVKGGFGIFDEREMRGLLRRSLLWCRDSQTSKLVRIDFASDTYVPSWSWMAYNGAISYLPLKFGAWEWEDLESPWSNSTEVSDAAESISPLRETTLVAKARDLDLGAALEDEGGLILDDPATVLRDTTVCVVLGGAKGATSALEQKNCVLIIEPTKDKAEEGKHIYERVGTGFLPGKCISRVGFEVHIH